MHRELQRSLNPFLLVWNPSFYSLISYGFSLIFSFGTLFLCLFLWSEALISNDSRPRHWIEMIQSWNWQKIVWTCWSTLFVEGPTLTVDHALTLDHATVDLSIRLHSLGGEVVQFQLCAARWHLVSIAHLLYFAYRQVLKRSEGKQVKRAERVKSTFCTFELKEASASLD